MAGELLAGVRGSFGSGGSSGMNSTLLNMLLNDPYQKAQYEAELKQWLEDNKQDAVMADSEQLSTLAPAIEALKSRESMNEATRGLVDLALAGTHGRFRTDTGLKAATELLKEVAQGTRHAGEDTNDIKEYNLYRSQTQNPIQFEEWQQKFAPGKSQVLAVADELMKADPSMDRKTAILVAQHQDPNLAGAVATQKENAKADAAFRQESEKEQAKDVVEMMRASPNAIYGYNNTIESAGNVMKSLDSIEKMMAENPFSTGLFSDYLKRLPESSAMQVADLITTIEANNVLNGMQLARQNSPTGATGFGALDKGERELLAGQIATLRQGGSPEEIKKAIGAIREHYERVRKQTHEQWKADYDWIERNKNVVPRTYRPVGQAPEYKPWPGTVDAPGQGQSQGLSMQELAQQELERRRGR